MEAIQKALAKAKQSALQEKALRDKSVPDKVNTVNDLADSLDVIPDAVTAHDLDVSDKGHDDISYQQTKIVDINPRELFTNRVHAASPKNVVGDIFKMLRAQVLIQMREKNLKTLAVTGATEGVGKSLVSTNLAISLSLETNQTIMLVDLDLKRPSIATYFGIETQIDKGIGDYLLNDTPLNEVLINPGMERLVLLPGRKAYQNSPEIISSQKMFNLIDDLKSRYESRIIIFDLPPILATPDAFSLMPHFDASLLVIEDGRNTRDELNASFKMMEKTEFLGSVLNKGIIQHNSYY